MLLPMEPRHLAEVRKIVHFHWTQLGAQFYWPPPILEDELIKSLGFVFEVERQVAAFILSRKQSVNIQEVTCLAVSPQYQRSNVMSPFFKDWIQELKSHQISEVWLEVHEKNQAAIRFYERHLFIKVGERPKYYSDKSAAYLYSLYLGE